MLKNVAQWIKNHQTRKARVLGLAFLLGIAALWPQAAQAETITCTGVGADTTTNATHIFYDSSAKTCTVSDIAPSVSTGDMYAYVDANNGDKESELFADNNLDGLRTNKDHNGCTRLPGNNAPTNVSAGQACTQVLTADGSYTMSITANVSNGVEGTLSVNVTVASGPHSMDVTSASVTLPGGDETSSNTTPSTPPSLQASVSRSQTTVVSTNIGTRLASVGSSPVGVSRTTPGAGRTTPGAGRTVPSGNTPTSTGGGTTTGGTTAPDGDQANLSEDQSRTTGYDKLPLRQLAMAMSFDSSNMILAAAGDDTSPVLAPEQRESLLADRPLTVWGHGSYTDVTNTRNDTSGDSRYGGDVWGYNVGMDYRLQPNLYVGASLGFSQTDLTTTYNAGTYDEDSWTLTPYVVFKPTDEIKLSGMFGYGISSIDQTRTSGTVTSNSDSAMWFAALNASYTIKPAEDLPLDLKASMGFLVTNKKVDAYTESDGTQVAAATSNTRQIKPGLEASYSFDLDEATILQPFVKTDWIYDFKDPINNDANAFDLGGGVRIGSSTGFNGSLEGNTQLGRSDYREHTLSGMVAYSFALGASGEDKASFVEPYVQSDFNKDVRTMGTGLSFRSLNDALVAKISLDQTAVRDSDAKSMAAKLTLDMKF